MRISDLVNSTPVPDSLPKRPSMMVVLHVKPLSHVRTIPQQDNHAKNNSQESLSDGREEIHEDANSNLQLLLQSPEPEVISVSPSPSDLIDSEAPQTPVSHETPSGTPSPSSLLPFPSHDFLQVGPSIVLHRPSSILIRTTPDNFHIVDPYYPHSLKLRAHLFSRYKSLFKTTQWSEFYQLHQNRGDKNFTMCQADLSLLSFVQPRLLAICMGCEKVCFRVFEGSISGLEGHQRVCTGTGHGHYFVEGVAMNHRSPMTYMVFDDDSLEELPKYRRGYLAPGSRKKSMPLIDELDLVSSQEGNDDVEMIQMDPSITFEAFMNENGSTPSSPVPMVTDEAKDELTSSSESEEDSDDDDDNDDSHSSTRADRSFSKSMEASDSFIEIGKGLYQHIGTKLIFIYDSVTHTVKAVNPVTLSNPRWLKRKLNEEFQYIQTDESWWSEHCYELIDPMEKNFSLIHVDNEMMTILPLFTVTVCKGCMKKCFDGSKEKRSKSFESHLMRSPTCLSKMLMAEYQAIAVDQQTPVTFFVFEESQKRKTTPSIPTAPVAPLLETPEPPTEKLTPEQLLAQMMKDIRKEVRSAHSSIKASDRIMKPDVHAFLRGSSPTTQVLLQTMLLEYLKDETLKPRDVAKQIKFRFAPMTGRLQITDVGDSMDLQLLLKHERDSGLHKFTLSLTIVLESGTTSSDQADQKTEHMEAGGLQLGEVCSLLTLFKIVTQLVCKRNSKAIAVSRTELKDLIFECLESVEMDAETMGLLFYRYLASRLSNI